MKKFKTFVGINVSKKTVDAAVLQAASPQKVQHQVFAQSAGDYTALQAWIQEQTGSGEVLICMEHTGIYIKGLVGFLSQQELAVWVEAPLRIKKSMGLQRGGDDKLAAIRIAQYAYRYCDQVRLWSPTDASVEELKQYITQRDRHVGALT